MLTYLLKEEQQLLELWQGKWDEKDPGEIFKNYASFINCRSEINNTEKDDGKNIDIVMSMYNLIQ